LSSPTAPGNRDSLIVRRSALVAVYHRCYLPANLVFGLVKLNDPDRRLALVQRIKINGKFVIQIADYRKRFGGNFRKDLLVPEVFYLSFVEKR
jgi:hypothetical protein